MIPNNVQKYHINFNVKHNKQCHLHICIRMTLHTCYFSLPIFLIFKDRVGYPHPWMMFAKLRKYVVCYESHSPRKNEKHQAE